MLSNNNSILNLSNQFLKKFNFFDFFFKLWYNPEPIIVPEIKLTPLEIKDNELKEAYKKVQHECLKVIPKQKLPVPKKRIDELLNLLKTNKFSIYDVRAIAYPICIEYKLEESSFWHWIQVKRGVWKS